MTYLVDTNVISETFKPKPNEKVASWFRAVSFEDLFISVLTLGEIRKGIEKLEDGRRKNQIILWLNEASELGYFGTRIIPIDLKIAERWGYLSAHTKRTLPAIDELIASTALVHNLKIVTRNVKDFDFPGVEIINPFEGV